MSNFRMFFRLARPLQLLLASLMYSLGAGIARYLGHQVAIPAFILGLLVTLLVQVAAFYLVEYFHLPLTPLAKDEKPIYREGLRTSLFQSAIALLTVSGAIILTLLLARLLSQTAGILLILIVIFFVAYSIPPLHLAETGYGELVQATVLGTLFPALAFLLQFGEFHRLLIFVSFPMTLLAIAYLLVNDFPTFAGDLKYGRQTLLTRLTWQVAIPIHHILALLSFLFFATAPLLGIPARLIYPVFLAFPFALLEIVWLQRIALGGRTIWKFLIPLAVIVFGLSAYLLTLSFWIL